MLFSIFNPPKGKVLRKRSHNIPDASDTTLSRRPTKKSKPTPAPPPTTFKPLPEPPSLPEITLIPGPDPVSSPPPPSKSPRPKPTRSTSLKKRNSHVPLPFTDPLPPLYLDTVVGNGKQEETKPARRKSVIRRVLDKRRERIEAGNNYYNAYILQANGGERQEYDPKLGVENLPLRQYSGLHIGSPSQLLVDGGTGDRREGRSELGGEEIGVAVSGDEREEGREKGKRREGAETRRGGYWGDFPSHSYGGSYGGLPGVGYVTSGHSGGEYGGSISHGGDHEGYSAGDYGGNGGDGGGADGGGGGD